MTVNRFGRVEVRSLFAVLPDYVNVFIRRRLRRGRHPTVRSCAITALGSRVCPGEDITMPKSKVRKKDVYTAPTDRRTPVRAKMAGPSNPVYVVVMLGMMIIGLAWLVVTYLASDKIAFMNSLGSWNFAIGFALMIGGLLMTMRWR
jgi:Cell division protein CrgA